MKSREIRSRYLAFFEKRGHKACRSDSLVPENDPTLLFTGAGMNQFKDQFLGRNISFRRATTCQKCIRLPDLENVGRTPSHHTFFEMLGNFSFGDYFKKEAIEWAQEFLLNDLKLDPGRLWYTVYTEDDEAAEIWHKAAGVPRERIFRYGEKDNFWPSEAPSKGPNGPCGPCSEIYFDFAPERGRPAEGPAIDGTRFVEIWNLVFTQFDRQDGGVLKPLPQRNIDTGAGFERIVRVIQGGATNFDTDLFQPLLARIAEASGKTYGRDPAADVKMRRIADHVRAVTFCIADGVRPSNEQRGYVVRKVLRRALMDWWNLGAKGVGLESLVAGVVGIDGLADFYPEIREHRERAERLVAEEAAKFAEVYEKGSVLLGESIDALARERQTVLDGTRAFFLWDTVGFPLDLTRRTLEERGLTLDEDGYRAAMEAQRRKSQLGTNLKEIFDTGPLARLKEIGTRASRFTGYDALDSDSEILGIIQGEELAFDVAAGADPDEERPRVHIVLRETPFYAESGGQVGDRGEIVGATGRGIVHDTRKVGQFILHETELTKGSFKTGDRGSRGGVRRSPLADHAQSHRHASPALGAARGAGQGGRAARLAGGRPPALRLHLPQGGAGRSAHAGRAPGERAGAEEPAGEQGGEALEEAKRSVRSRCSARSMASGCAWSACRMPMRNAARSSCAAGRTASAPATSVPSRSSPRARSRRACAASRRSPAWRCWASSIACGCSSWNGEVLKVDLDAVPGKVEALQAELKKLKKDLEKAQKSGASDHLQEISAAVRPRRRGGSLRRERCGPGARCAHGSCRSPEAGRAPASGDRAAVGSGGSRQRARRAESGARRPRRVSRRSVPRCGGDRRRQGWRQPADGARPGQGAGEDPVGAGTLPPGPARPAPAARS
ncbi:MAG: alanine--tRNA ligase [Planctomycetota bacterium]